MSYFDGKLLIGINELYCPGVGWVPAAQYQPAVHGVPTTANVKCVDADGHIYLQADITEREYRSLLTFPAVEDNDAE